MRKLDSTFFLQSWHRMLLQVSRPARDAAGGCARGWGLLSLLIKALQMGI